VAGCEGQQGDVPGLLDGAGEAALVRGANAGQTPGNDLAAFGNETLQQADVTVRDGIDLLGAELADLFAAEELAASAGTAGWARTAGWASAAGVATRTTLTTGATLTAGAGGCSGLRGFDLIFVRHWISFSWCCFLGVA
jgi:hypothetical protein